MPILYAVLSTVQMISVLYVVLPLTRYVPSPSSRCPDMSPLYAALPLARRVLYAVLPGDLQICPLCRPPDAVLPMTVQCGGRLATA